jgi:uncharacterized protein (TIGR04255 family)
MLCRPLAYVRHSPRVVEAWSEYSDLRTSVSPPPPGEPELSHMDEVGNTRHYNRAPIFEAMLAFSWAPEEASEEPVLDQIGKLLADKYPRWQYVLPTGQIATTPLPGDIAVEFRAFASEDGRSVVKVGRASFSVHVLAPYDSWEPFLAEAHRVADIYFSAISRPVGGVDLSVRYLNLFAIPFRRPLHEFFNVYPAWPERDVLFNRLYMRAETSIVELPGTLTVYLTPRGKESTAPGAPEAVPEAPDSFEMYLDNHFRFRIQDFDRVWALMDRVRKIKNDTFNSQITERLKEVIS